MMNQYQHTAELSLTYIVHAFYILTEHGMKGQKKPEGEAN
jgi:hypothetical protein